MKKKIFLIVIIALLIVTFNHKVYGESLGDIDLYKLTVSPSSSGKLNMVYHLEVIIKADEVDKMILKVPSSNFIVKSKCDQIKSIENEENFAIINFDRKYRSGEKLSLNFNLLQSNMYTINISKKLCKFKFKLGYIKNFNINKMKLQWAKKSVKFCQSGIENDKYYVIERKYSIIRNFNVLVEYDMDKFNLIDGEEREISLYDLVDNYFLVALGIFIIVTEFIIYKRKGSRY